MREIRSSRLVVGLTLAAALTAALAACASPGTDSGAAGASSSPASAPSSPDGSRVRPGFAKQVIVTKTGGFAGLEQKVTVAEDGTWTYTDVRAERTETGKLADDKLQRLHGLADSNDLLTAPTGKSDQQCADMFIYGVTVGDTVASSDSCGLPPNETFAEILALVTDETPL